MTKYKYSVEARPPGRDLADWLNEHAAEGWRLVQVAPAPTRDYFTGAQDSLYYFEREMPDVEFKERVGDLNRKMLDL